MAYLPNAAKSLLPEKICNSVFFSLFEKFLYFFFKLFFLQIKVPYCDSEPVSFQRAEFYSFRLPFYGPYVYCPALEQFEFFGIGRKNSNELRGYCPFILHSRKPESFARQLQEPQLESPC